MKTRILARCHRDGELWTCVAYQSEGVFSEARRTSKSEVLEAVKTQVREIVTSQAKGWIDAKKRPAADIVNCPEAAIRLPIDIWTCKLTKDVCPVQGQVYLNDRDLFFQHCRAPQQRREQIFSVVATGTYDGFHHVPGRFLCPACEHEGRKPALRYHYPWELTHLQAYFSFEYERDWPSVRKKLRNKTFSLNLVSSALCAPHSRELAEQLDPALAAELFIIDFDLSR